MSAELEAAQDREKIAQADKAAARAEIELLKSEIADLEKSRYGKNESRPDLDHKLYEEIEADLEKVRKAKVTAELKEAKAEREILLARREAMALAAERARKKAEENRQQREKEKKLVAGPNPEDVPGPEFNPS